jgi:hypothetical protein
MLFVMGLVGFDEDVVWGLLVTAIAGFEADTSGLGVGEQATTAPVDMTAIATKPKLWRKKLNL